jgi:hypothetical protein
MLKKHQKTELKRAKYFLLFPANGVNCKQGISISQKEKRWTMYSQEDETKLNARLKEWDKVIDGAKSGRKPPLEILDSVKSLKPDVESWLKSGFRGDCTKEAARRTGEICNLAALMIRSMEVIYTVNGAKAYSTLLRDMLKFYKKLFQEFLDVEGVLDNYWGVLAHSMNYYYLAKMPKSLHRLLGECSDLFESHGCNVRSSEYCSEYVLMMIKLSILSGHSEERAILVLFKTAVELNESFGFPTIVPYVESCALMAVYWANADKHDKIKSMHKHLLSFAPSINETAREEIASRMSLYKNNEFRYLMDTLKPGGSKNFVNAVVKFAYSMKLDEIN